MGPESFLGLEGRELAREISGELDLVRILGKASEPWDGGYVFVGLLGNGDGFVCRDPAGIRPAYYYIDEEVVAAASERAALANVFDVDPGRIEPLAPAHALVVKRNGRIDHRSFTAALPVRSCSFERIYFSRGSDPAIYEERKNLGHALAPRVLASLGDDLEHAVFSYIPNTAEAAHVGLTEEIDRLARSHRVEEVWQRIEQGNAKRADLERLLNGRLRTEKVAYKDQRLRTFITHDAARRDLVLHIYDITRGVVRPDDTLVVLDDSIVRGTTLRESIITMLSRLNPQRIIIVSSAPPIMYPDCYGIDMSQLGRFIAFEAASGAAPRRGSTPRGWSTTWRRSTSASRSTSSRRWSPGSYIPRTSTGRARWRSSTSRWTACGRPFRTTPASGTSPASTPRPAATACSTAPIWTGERAAWAGRTSSLSHTDPWGPAALGDHHGPPPGATASGGPVPAPGPPPGRRPRSVHGPGPVGSRRTARPDRRAAGTGLRAAGRTAGPPAPGPGGPGDGAARHRGMPDAACLHAAAAGDMQPLSGGVVRRGPRSASLVGASIRSA
jgi:hypothetical protein